MKFRARPRSVIRDRGWLLEGGRGGDRQEERIYPTELTNFHFLEILFFAIPDKNWLEKKKKKKKKRASLFLSLSREVREIEKSGVEWKKTDQSNYRGVVCSSKKKFRSSPRGR